MDHFDKMASNLLKDMGNKESLNQSEKDASSPVVESGESMRIQERAITGKLCSSIFTLKHLLYRL